MKIPFLKNNLTDSDAIDYRIPAVIFALAFIIRLAILINFAKSPSFNVPLIDEDNYNNLARSLAAGERMDRSFFWQPFFYPIFLSMIYFFTGSSATAAKIIQIIIGSLTALVVYLTAKEIFDKKTGIISGIIAAVYAPLIFFETMLLSEGLAAFFSALLLFMLVKIREKNNFIMFFLLGTVSGLSIITRPTFLFFVIIAFSRLSAGFLKNKMPGRLILIKSLALILGLFIVLFPVSLKNFLLTKNFSFLPHSGPVNFYIGNNPDSDKTLLIRPGTDWDNLVFMAKNSGAKNLQDEQRYYSGLVADYILNDPVHFAGGLFKKTMQLISSREIPRTTDIYVFRKYSSVFSMFLWKAGKFGFPFGLLLPLALMGIIYNYKKIPACFYFLLIAYSFSVILVFVSSRQRLPLMPALFTISAAGITGSGSIIKAELKNKKWMKLSASAISVIILFAIITIPGPFASEKFNYESEMLSSVASSCLGKGNVNDSVRYLNEALSSDPGNKVAYRLLGLICLVQNNYKGSAEYFNRAISIDPCYAEAYYDYGNLFYMQKNYDEALNKFRETIRLSPGFYEAYINAGSIYFIKKDFNESIKYFTKALEAKNADSLAHKKIGDAYIETVNFEKAIFHFKKAFEISPDADTAYMLANLYFQDDPATYDIEESKKWAEISAGLSGDKNAEYLFMLAVISLKSDGKDQACDYAEKALTATDPSQEKELIDEIKEFIYKNKKDENDPK